MLKKIAFLICIAFLQACENKPTVPIEVKPIRTGRIELASVCAQTIFMVDDSNFSGDRLGIYRSGRCEYTAYIDMEQTRWDVDSAQGTVTIYCPDIKIASPKYHYNELDMIYKVKGPFRNWITQKEKHHYENKMVEQLKDSLRHSEAFTEKLKEKAQASAKILLPKLFSFNKELKTEVKFD